MTDEEKIQKQEYESIIEQKKRLVKRTAHQVKDDVKYGITPKSALVVEPLHKLGVPTSMIQRGAVAISDTAAFLTKSDKQLCEYYANYDKISEAKKSEIGNIVKAVDRQEESLMDAKADLSSTKLRYSAYKSSTKQSERLAKANGLASTVTQESVKDGLSGITADYASIDKD